MLLAVIGDVHGAFTALDRAIDEKPDVACWLSVGDLAADDGRYPHPSRPLYFIKGNNEDFDVIARLERETFSNLHLLPNGRLVELSGIRVAGLGGTFAPKWYDTDPRALPADLSRRSAGGAKADLSRRSTGGAKADDKRRHFVRSEVEALGTLGSVDLFLTHEAPRPYWVGAGRRRNDAGKTVINELLAALKPRLHVFGHHHRFSEAVPEGVPSVGLPLVTEGYLVVDSDTWQWEFVALEVGTEK